jgi:hypothetical protein
LADTNRTGSIQAYKTALTLGNTRSLQELFGVAGLVFPFTAQAIKEAVQSILDQSGKITVA